MARGRASTRSKIEAVHGNFFDLIREHCKKSTNLQEACNSLNAFVGNSEMEMQPPTLLRTISKALDAKEIEEDEFFVPWTKVAKGKRGKKSLRSKIEEKHGDIWAVIRKHCDGCTNKEDACETLNDALSDSSLTMQPQTMLNTILKGIDDDEVTEEDFFFKWAARKRRGRKTTLDNSEPVDHGPLIVIDCVCQNCESTRTLRNHERDVKEFGIGVGAFRCQKCNQWGTIAATYEIDGKTLTEKVENWEALNTKGPGAIAWKP